MKKKPSRRSITADFALGTVVSVEGLSGKFEICEGPNGKGEYLLARGALTLRVPGSSLRASNSKVRPVSRGWRVEGRSCQTAVGHSPSLDLHGCSVEQSLELLEQALSDALLSRASRLEVIHGIGTGVLKEAVHRYLAASPHVERFELAAHNPGSTWVLFE